ncbi:MULTISPECIES: hypothetical protein [unclassified Halomonas]|uniref:hypothetical protein n=1 Tax=unclassified Halomonas TaxID=2609666 RepID=UPI0040347098
MLGCRKNTSYFTVCSDTGHGTHSWSLASALLVGAGALLVQFFAIFLMSTSMKVVGFGGADEYMNYLRCSPRFHLHPLYGLIAPLLTLMPTALAMRLLVATSIMVFSALQIHLLSGLIEVDSIF